MKIDLFQSCGHCQVFQICWHIECNTLTASCFRILGAAGIPSPPLALLAAVLPNALLASHSRMSGSRWVITPMWLSGSLRSSVYSSVCSWHLFLILPASVMSSPFLSFTVPIFTWNVPLIFPIFLKRSLVSFMDTALSCWRGLCNSMKLWTMPHRATQDGRFPLGSSDIMWSTGARHGKTTPVFSPWEPHELYKKPNIHQFSSVQSLSCVWLFTTTWTAACQDSLSITNTQSLLKLMSIELVIPSNHLTLCHPLFLLLSISPSFRVFSNESVLHIRWPKYSSFSFSISPSNEYSGLTSLRIDWLEMFIAALFTIAKIWKHLKCPSTDEWIKMLKRTEFCSLQQQGWTWMALGIVEAETRQRRTNTIWYHSYVGSKKHNRLIMGESSRQTDTENKVVVTRTHEQGTMGWRSWRYKLPRARQAQGWQHGEYAHIL